MKSVLNGEVTIYHLKGISVQYKFDSYHSAKDYLLLFLEVTKKFISFSVRSCSLHIEIEMNVLFHANTG